MEINAARDLANDLMSEYLVGWTLEFDQAKRRHGVCKFRFQTISLSAPLTRVNDEAQVSDTIRHEIAHAIAGPGAKHGPIWREACYVTGANPQRCASSDAVRVQAPWRRECPAGCGNSARAHRKSSKQYYCGRCLKRDGSKNILVYVPQDIDKT